LKKKITIVGLNFYPEDTAIGLYSTQLAEYLVNNGFDVSVITGFPYYPMWKIPKAYQNRPKNFIEYHKGVQIIRYKQYIPENPTFLKRILLLLDFTFGAYKNASKIKETDLVFTVVPFTSAIIVGNKISKKNKVKHWVHIQDFEFDAAAETSLVGNKKLLFKVLFWIEKILLNKPDFLSTISNAMLLKLNTKVRSNKKTVLLPNWVDVDKINPSKSKQHHYLKTEKFKILYSGNIGEKQDWKLFLEVVNNINDDNIQFIVVGSGAKKDWLIKKINKLDNVIYYPPVPYNELPDLLCSADLHILFQKNNVIDTVMPSKILGMMASEKPSLISGNLKSEVAIVISESKGGFYLQPKTYSEIIELIFKIKNDSSNYGKKAREYVTKNFSSEQILNKFKENINLLLKSQKI
jgi:colanic acid biosynthesis glycosyl transferase WcaI